MKTIEKNNIVSREVMPCGYTDKSESQLQKEGWEEHWSFHTNIPEQWDDACRRARTQRMMNYDVTLVYDRERNAKYHDSIAVIYRFDKMKKNI